MLWRTRQHLNRIDLKMEDLAFGNGQDPLVIFTSGFTPLQACLLLIYLPLARAALAAPGLRTPHATFGSDSLYTRVRSVATNPSIPSEARLPTLTLPGNLVV